MTDLATTTTTTTPTLDQGGAGDNLIADVLTSAAALPTMPPGYAPGLSRAMSGERALDGGPVDAHYPDIRANPEPRQTEDRSTPDNSNSWGRSESIAWDTQPQEVARVVLETSQPLTLTMSVPTPPTPGQLPAGALVPVSAWARVTIGAGSSSTTRPVRIDDILTIALPPASFVSVQIFMGTTDTGAPVAATSWSGGTAPGDAYVTCSVARGTRGTPQIASTFATAETTGKLMITGPARVLSLAAHLSGTVGSPVWLQLHDLAAGTPAAGAVPRVEVALVDTADTERTWINGRGFGSGVYAALSSTSGTYTSVESPTAWIEIETQLL